MSQALSATTARIAQAVWVVLAVAGIVINVVSAASGWATLDTICHAASTCSSGGQLDASAARTLSHYGISINAFAVSSTVVPLAIVATFYALGALIIWRRPEDRGPILAAFFLVVFPSFLNPSIPFVLFFLALILFGLLFPDGRFAPRWTRWLALAAMLASLSTILSAGPASLADAVILLLVIAMQIYRFRSISTWSQRQQTKWTVFGLAAAISGFFAIMTSSIWAPWQTAGGSLYFGFTNVVAFPVVISAIPISLAVSVLRSRLWDIDRIISRALAYTTLSLVLAGIYVGSVIGLQRLFQVFAGNSSTIAIALSTLAIAALFGPLRHRIQATIDRRFYRAKYDGTRAVAAFAQRLRDEVDLAQLSQDMTSVVRDTLQPTHVSLWLREGRHNADVPRVDASTSAN